MERTGYESLGTLASLDGRVDHLRETIQWAVEHRGTAEYDFGAFRDHLLMELDRDEAYEMNRLYDEAHALDAELARRKVEATGALDALGEAGF